MANYEERKLAEVIQARTEVIRRVKQWIEQIPQNQVWMDEDDTDAGNVLRRSLLNSERYHKTRLQEMLLDQYLRQAGVEH